MARSAGCSPTSCQRRTWSAWRSGELGVRNLTNNKHPVAKLEDIAGLKIRAQQSPLFLDVWRALGANPTPLPFTEVHTALETGTVDGQENPAALILASKFNEVQKYLSLTHHNYNPQIVLIGKGSVSYTHLTLPTIHLV